MGDEMIVTLEREVLQRGGFGVRFVVSGEVCKCEVYVLGPPGRDGKRMRRYLATPHRISPTTLPEIAAKLKRDGFGVEFSGTHAVLQQMEAASSSPASNRL